MQKLNFSRRITASLRGAIVPFLPRNGTGPADNFLTISSLFGKQDPTPIKSAADAYDRYLGWVRAAVSLIAFDVRSSEFTIWDRRGSQDREEWEPISPAEYPGVLKRPNGSLTFQDLIEINQMSLDLTGEGFWHLITKANGGRVDGIQFIRTEWVSRYITNENQTEIKEWEIQVNDSRSGIIQVVPKDLIHFKYPNPSDPVRGCSPLAAMATSADIDTYIRSYVNGFVKGGAVPPVAIKSALSKMTNEQHQAIIEKWQNRYEQNSGVPAVLTKDSDVKIIGWPLKDLDLDAITKFSREQILAIYGVPAAKFGIKDMGGLSEDTEGYEYSYQKNCIRPRLRRTQEEINLFLIPRVFPDRDVYFEYHDPVAEDVKLKMEIAGNKLNNGAITINEYRGEMGDESVPDGDVYLLPSTASRVPAGELNLIPEVMALQLRLSDVEQKALKLTQTTGTYRMQLAQLEFLRSQDAQERTLKSKVRGQFSREQKMVLDALDKVGLKAGDKLESHLKYVGPGLETPAGFIKEYAFTGGIIEQTNLEAWTEMEVQAVRTGLASGVTLVATEIGQAETISTVEMAKRANQLAGERAGLITNDTYKAINEVVDKALDTGAGTEEIRQAILGKYDNWKGYRAEAIARTETANAVNTGKFWGAEEAAQEYDLKLKKEWVSTLDGNTRGSHISANGQKRELKEPFDVGSSKLMNPGEYGGPAGEVINCRCTVVFSVLD